MSSIKGLDALTKKMDQLARFTEELDGAIADVSFDPSDPSSIENAIQKATDAIDSKANAYGRNDLVANIAEEVKERIRNEILERAATARLEGGDE